MAVILVVEDSLTISTVVQGMLSKHGYAVRVASDGLVALSALKVFEPDLVLLDIRLPHVDGFQLCQFIRRKLRYAHLPVVMLSALSTPADMQRAVEAGANDYLVKPVDEKTLLATVRMHLGRTELRAG